ncbi:MAG: DsbA family protein [Gemmatimonadaceae bacterium]
MNRPSGGKKNPTATARKTDSKRWFYILIAVLLVVGIATIGYQATRPTAATIFEMDSTITLVANQGHVIGSETAPVEVVEFADFECPACGQFATITEPDVRARLVNTGMIRFRFMDFPLEGHRNTRAAHMAAWCASDQGKFWEMHDMIFATQDRWSTYATSRPLPVFESLAQQIGLDVQQYQSCMETRKFLGQIQSNVDEGLRRGVNSTPTFFIGNRKVATTVSYDEFRQHVNDALAQAAATKAPGTTSPQPQPAQTKRP